jgi:hypothetical protein
MIRTLTPNLTPHTAPPRACSYNSIVFAIGASDDHLIGIPNERSLRNVFSARQMVNWCVACLCLSPCPASGVRLNPFCVLILFLWSRRRINGHPSYSSLDPVLHHPSCIIIGNGKLHAISLNSTP